MQNNQEQIRILRSEIDVIHAEMIGLFRRRLNLVKKIWVIKKNINSPMLDSAREETIIHQFDSSVTDTKEKTSVQNFLKFILDESKSYMENL